VIIRRVKELCLVAQISNKNSPREEFTLDNTCLVRTLFGPSSVQHHSRPQYKHVLYERMVPTLKRRCELRKVYFPLHHIAIFIKRQKTRRVTTDSPESPKTPPNISFPLSNCDIISCCAKCCVMKG